MRPNVKTHSKTTLAMVATIVSHLNISCSAVARERTIVFDSTCTEQCVENMRAGMNVWNLQTGTTLTERSGHRKVIVYVSDDCGPDAVGRYIHQSGGPDYICLNSSVLATTRGKSTAIHELGHSMGLGHVRGRGHVMSESSYGTCLDQTDIDEYCTIFTCTEREFACDR